MGVIVNELEVVTEPPPAGAAGAVVDAGAAEAPQAPEGPGGPTPDDVRRIARHHDRRQRRLWAH